MTAADGVKSATNARWRRVVGRILLVVVSVALTTKLVDVGIGIADPYGVSHFEHKRTFDTEALRPWRERSTASFAIHELVPSREVVAGSTYRINALGFRGRETTTEKPAGTWRIVVLGDSVAFGWGVEADERFTDVAEARWNLAHPDGPRIEVLNLGVPGYEAHHQYYALHDKALALHPDAIVFAFNWNDVQLIPDEIVTHVRGEFESRVDERGWLARRLMAMTRRPRKEETGVSATARRLFAKTLPHLRGLLSYATVFALKPGDEETMRASFAAMTDGIKTAGEVYSNALAEATAAGARLGVADLYAFEPIAAELKRRGVPYANMSFDTFDSDLSLRNSPADPHPNPGGHARLADTFLAALRSMNLLPEEDS